jgi:hypothetical protein
MAARCRGRVAAKLKTGSEKRVDSDTSSARSFRLRRRPRDLPTMCIDQIAPILLVDPGRSCLREIQIQYPYTASV